MSGLRLLRLQSRHGRRGSGLTWRRDLTLPVAVAAVQLAGSYLAYGYLHYQHSYVSGAGGSPELRGHLALGLLEHRPAHLTTIDWVLLLVGPAALAARHRRPVAVAWLAFVPVLAPSPPWFAWISLALACFGAAVAQHRRAAWTVLACGYISSLWLAPLAWGHPLASPALALFAAAWLAVLVTGSEAARMRRERRAQARAARELDERRRASEERLRMARELHDVIGHTISLINLQAGVGLDLMDTQPEQARTALTAVRTVSREALGELRTLLCALRETGEEAPRTPAAGLSGLPELISRSGAAGLAVATDIAGRPRPLPTAVDLAAYRVVQEALTNAARHAGLTSVTIRVDYGEHDLHIEVADEGPPGTAASGGPAGGGGPGTGICGLRERVAALGGQLDAGPRSGRGFKVRARFPLSASP